MREKLNQLSRLLDIPGLGPEDARRRKLLNVMLLAVAASAGLLLAVLLVAVPLGVAGGQVEVQLLGLGGVLALLGVAVVYLLNRHVSGELASALFLLLLIAVAAFSDKPQQVVDGRGLLVFAIPILAASVLLRPWVSFVAAGACALVVVVIGLVVVRQPVPNLPAIPALFLLALMSWLSARSLEHALRSLRASNALLQESEERYRLHFEHVSDVIFSIDRDFRMADISPSVERLLGYKPQALIGKPLRDLNVLTPDSLQQALSDTRRVLAGQRVSSAYQFVAQDGTRRWGEVSAAPLVRDGQVVALIAVARDITERRSIEEQLRQQERLAAVGQLAGGIAHDFNNILAAIILYAQMPLDRPDLSTSVRDSLQTILKESRRAADLIQQILDFSRSAMMKTEPLSLVAMVTETLTLLRRTIPEHIRLVTEITSHPCTVQADPTRIQQVLMNLAVNAKDAMPEGGGLRITIAPVAVEPGDEPPLADMPLGDWACLTVSDTGTGMTEEVQDHLFEPFFTTKQPGKGTGLGLAQVYGIVKQHQGYIDVDTAVGEGTTFTIFLPLVDRREGESKASGTTYPVRGRGETILVVEDAEQLRRGIKAGMESLGYHVITAANGREALQAIWQQPVDLVLTDVVMPEMGGEALLRSLQAEDPQVTVVAITGHIMDADIRELRSAGFADVLLKPLSIEELSRVVRDVLDKSP